MAVTGAAIAGWAAANAGTIALVSTAASVAATGYQVYSQGQQAAAEAEAQKQYNKQVQQQAVMAYDDLSPAEIDANRQANEEAMNQQAELFQAKGRVNVFAAASGTLGGSVDSLLFDYTQQRDRNISSILNQREAGLYSIKQQAESLRQNSISSQNISPISKPSWMEGAFKIGSSIVAGADRLSTTSKTTDKLTRANASTSSV